MALGGDTIERMRSASGSVSDDRALVQFLYILLRDHLTAGAVETILEDHVTGRPTVFTNGWTAAHAQDIAARLTCDATGERNR
jgi:hypothetical protein